MKVTCCFCGQPLSHDGAVILTVQKHADSEASQAFYAHKADLIAALNNDVAACLYVLDEE